MKLERRPGDSKPKEKMTKLRQKLGWHPNERKSN